MPDRYGLFIGGEWVSASGDETIPVVNPCDVDETVGVASVASEQDVDRAVGSAREVFLAWRETPAKERGEMMHAVADALREHKDELGELVRRETGRIAKEAPGEVTGTAGLFDYFAEEALRLRGSVAQADDRDRMVLILKEPVGVVAAIAPWLRLPARLACRRVSSMW